MKCVITNSRQFVPMPQHPEKLSFDRQAEAMSHLVEEIDPHNRLFYLVSFGLVLWFPSMCEEESPFTFSPKIWTHF